MRYTWVDANGDEPSGWIIFVAKVRSIPIAQVAGKITVHSSDGVWGKRFPVLQVTRPRQSDRCSAAIELAAQLEPFFRLPRCRLGWGEIETAIFFGMLMGDPALPQMVCPSERARLHREGGEVRQGRLRAAIRAMQNDPITGGEFSGRQGGNGEDTSSVPRLPCPYLPDVKGPPDFGLLRPAPDPHLRYCLAQQLWVAGKPAQAILQLNKIWAGPRLMTDAAATLVRPYLALLWICARAGAGDSGFLGNPIRHFQHLASRVRGSHWELRSTRAWICMHLTAQVLPISAAPRDGRQLVRSGLWIPPLGRCLARLDVLGHSTEARAIDGLRSALADAAAGSYVP